MRINYSCNVYLSYVSILMATENGLWFTLLVRLRYSLYPFQGICSFFNLVDARRSSLLIVSSDAHVATRFLQCFRPVFSLFPFLPLRDGFSFDRGVFIRAVPGLDFLPFFLSFSFSLSSFLPITSLLPERSQRYAFWNLVSSQFEIRAAFIGRGLLSALKKYGVYVCVCVCVRVRVCMHVDSRRCFRLCSFCDVLCS